jgi:ectoine utilization protein EutC
MAKMQILTEPDLRRIVPLDAVVVACVEDAFLALATKKVVMPPILRLDIPDYRGEVDVKTVYVPGLDGFAIKISPGFFDNPQVGLPSLNGLMALFSARTGLIEALLLDNGYLTQIRTAAAGAVATKHLSRISASTAAVLGAGEQARLQLEALLLVRPIERARSWGRDPAKAAAASADLAKRLGIRVEAAATAEIACSGADIIVTATPAQAPILSADWVVRGQHITALGSDAEHKNEIDPAIFNKAIYIADSLPQTRRLGELAHALRAGTAIADRRFAELGQVIAETFAGRPLSGRMRDDDITLCDLTGTGVQDTAIALLADRLASASGVGLAFETTERTGVAT